MYNILIGKLKNITKRSLKIVQIFLILICAILVLLVTKYKKVYKVSINGEKIGYTENVNTLKEKLDTQMYNEDKNKYMAFYSFDIEPEYKSVLVNRDTKTNDEEILNIIKNDTKITYLAYEIILDGQTKAYVSSIEEAEEIVDELKKDIEDEELEMQLSVAQKYTQDLSSLTISNKEEVEEKINEDIEKAIEIKGSTVNGVVLATIPVKGTYISSRYGDTADRSGGHCGLDIAAPIGRTIVACGDGIVKLASESYYGYGKLVIIDHGNGVETYYAHCSKLCVTKGQQVSAGDKIAEVGATGDVTGPHLHLEVRINGRTVNPQNYVYK